MNCKDLESMMADALGGELDEADREAIERHLAACVTCRRDYESSRRAVDSVRSLTGPRRVRVRREGGRLVIDAPPATGEAGGVKHHKPIPVWSSMRGLWRYAATILIAFTTGYLFHAGVMMSESTRNARPIATGADSAPDTVRGSFASVHVRHPKRSELAKCLAAIAHRR